MLTRHVRDVILLLLPLLSGCLFTVPMWEVATDRAVRDPRIEGVLTPETGANGQPTLVVRYAGAQLDDRYYVMVPLMEDGSAPQPFGYDGPMSSGPRIAEALPASQRQRLFATPMTFRESKWGKRVASDPRYRTWSWETDGSVSYDHDFARPATTSPASANCVGDDAGIRIRVFRIGRPWTDAERATWKSTSEYPADAKVLVMPYARPRPARDRNAAIARATLLTPATIVGDVVVTPLLFIGCYVFGQCP